MTLPAQRLSLALVAAFFVTSLFPVSSEPDATLNYFETGTSPTIVPSKEIATLPPARLRLVREFAIVVPNEGAAALPTMVPASLPSRAPAALPTRAPEVAAAQTPEPLPGMEAPERAGCDPAYPEERTCIPPGPPFDQGCAITGERRFDVLPPDPQRLDADGDGIGCEPMAGA